MEAKEKEAKILESKGNDLVTRNPKEALAEYTAAIEVYLTIASNANAPASQRARCRAACESLMSRAESLKRGLEKLTIKEETILLKSSRINGGKYPPLNRTPVISETELFIDPSGLLSLSKRQEELLLAWQRPHESLDDPQLFGGGGMFLVQDVITDCSLVASLCSAAAWEEKFDRKLVTANIFPNRVSPSGKYIVLLHLNGCIRQIVIDDYLPQGRRPLHVISQTNPNLLYPALMEKAFLKVMGGYDFPGSNSATDLNMLTGWIPEVVNLQDNETDLEQVWKRTFRAWIEGDVLATVGTGSLTPDEEREYCLVGDHNYSIFDMVKGMKVQLRNPWSQGGVPSEATRDAGTFWLDFRALCQRFKTLYLNWNPAIFEYSSTKHFSFTPNGSDFDIGSNAQISLKGSGDAWILLQRHYLGKAEGWEGYIGISVFPGTERIYTYSRPVYRTEYVEANHTLLKISGIPSPCVIVISANDKKSAPPLPEVFFSLTVYSKSRCELSEPVNALGHEVRMRGTWPRGVSYKSPLSTFVENPQWKLIVGNEKARILALLEGDEETAVNVTIAWSAGKRLARLANQDILCQSGEYALHHATTSARNVKPSTQYTVIASRFEEHAKARFTLVVRSDVQVELMPLREEWAGKSRKHIESGWEGKSIKRFMLEVSRLTSFSVRLSSLAKTPPFVRLCLQVNDTELISSGDQYTDLGLQTCEIAGDLLGGEEYVLCVERLGEDGTEFALDFLADGELEVEMGND